MTGLVFVLCLDRGIAVLIRSSGMFRVVFIIPPFEYKIYVHERSKKMYYQPKDGNSLRETKLSS
jgi:hypothetical protein